MRGDRLSPSPSKTPSTTSSSATASRSSRSTTSSGARLDSTTPATPPSASSAPSVPESDCRRTTTTPGPSTANGAASISYTRAASGRASSSPRAAAASPARKPTPGSPSRPPANRRGARPSLVRGARLERQLGRLPARSSATTRSTSSPASTRSTSPGTSRPAKPSRRRRWSAVSPRTAWASAARLLHRFQVDAVLPAGHRDTLRPVLYNSWEATHFDVQVGQQLELARGAAAMGVELFVVDDGWFGARDHDRAGLGDWSVNPRKFPNGLGALIDARPRPGHAVRHLGRARDGQPRQRPVPRPSRLGLPRPAPRADVRPQSAGAQLRAATTSRPGIHEQLRRLLAEHRDRLREVGPQPAVHRGRLAGSRPSASARSGCGTLQACTRCWTACATSSRTCSSSPAPAAADAPTSASLPLTDQVWTSDNTEAADRLPIQHGYSHAYAARTMVNWVTDVPNQQTGREAPLDFRFHVAMMGVLGVGGEHPGVDRRRAGAGPPARRGLQADPPDRAARRAALARLPRRPRSVRHPVRLGRPSEHGRDGLPGARPGRSRGAAGAAARPRPSSALPPDDRRPEPGAVPAESTGAALMGAGLPLFADAPPDPLHTADWLSEIQHWQATDG